jgi:hypothetical protein
MIAWLSKASDFRRKQVEEQPLANHLEQPSPCTIRPTDKFASRWSIIMLIMVSDSTSSPIITERALKLLHSHLIRFPITRWHGLLR